MHVQQYTCMPPKHARTHARTHTHTSDIYRSKLLDLFGCVSSNSKHFILKRRIGVDFADFSAFFRHGGAEGECVLRRYWRWNCCVAFS